MGIITPLFLSPTFFNVIPGSLCAGQARDQESAKSLDENPKLVLVCNEDAGVTQDGTEAFAMRLFMTTYINMSAKMNNLAFVAKRALQKHCPGILVTNEDK